MISGAGSIAKQTDDLFLLEDLDDASKTAGLAENDRNALQAVADWIKTFITQPNEKLGRPGPVCPFVPPAMERKRFWLAPEQISDRDASYVVERMNNYKRRYLDIEPTQIDDSNYTAIVVVFTDLPSADAPALFEEVLNQLGVPSYVEDGIIFGPFYEGNTGTALRNPDFRPFQSPVPFLFVREGVVRDWKFFLNNKEWLGHWAHRFGDAAVNELADEIRGLPWNARVD